ncbi:MAG: hypothetical protein PHY64_08775 [Eubacteriales bacterium]|nr:hypothetical protein [Eubacteriales bacterium]
MTAQRREERRGPTGLPETEGAVEAFFGGRGTTSGLMDAGATAAGLA